MTTINHDYADLVASVELVLNRSFEGCDLSHVRQAVAERVAELDVPAALEADFDKFSLERCVLIGLSAQLGHSPDTTLRHPTSLQVH